MPACTQMQNSHISYHSVAVDEQHKQQCISLLQACCLWQPIPLKLLILVFFALVFLLFLCFSEQSCLPEALSMSITMVRRLILNMEIKPEIFSEMHSYRLSCYLKVAHLILLFV